MADEDVNYCMDMLAMPDLYMQTWPQLIVSHLFNILAGKKSASF